MAELAPELVEQCQAFIGTQAIDGDPSGKSFLSIDQLMPTDIDRYLNQARIIESIIKGRRGGINLLPFVVLKPVMRQPSTRTAGTMHTAVAKLGMTPQVISGMASSSEAKGESLADSWLAFATQSDILGIRSEDDYGAAFAAMTITAAFERGKLSKNVPVINLGDGRNEHPTQALGDMHTIVKKFGDPSDLTISFVGDHERYRAHHSLMLVAAKLGMRVIAVESPVAPVPQKYVDLLGSNLERTNNLDEAMQDAHILYVGRNPDEYSGDNEAEIERSRVMTDAYTGWRITRDRLQQMDPDAMVLHPRPRRDEISPDCDNDPRMYDVQQMENMIPMRMAIVANHMGSTIHRRFPLTRDRAARLYRGVGQLVAH